MHKQFGLSKISHQTEEQNHLILFALYILRILFLKIYKWQKYVLVINLNLLIYSL